MRASTKADKAHMSKVADIGCILCVFLGLGETPAEIHHVRVRHGWGRTAEDPHKNTIGLCPPHHRGQPGGVHDFGREEFTEYYGISELELLELVKQKLGIC